MAQRLADTRCSLVDDDGAALIAAVTGLTQRVVRNRLNRAHGNTLVLNAFYEEWPNIVEQIRPITVALARDADLVVELAELTGLTRREIRDRIDSTPGRTLVGNAFPELEEASTDDDDDQDDEDDATDEDEDQADTGTDSAGGDDEDELAADEYDPDHAWDRFMAPEAKFSTTELIGEVRSPSVRGNADLTGWLAPHLGTNRRTVLLKLNANHGRFNLQRVLAAHWPPAEIDEPPRELLGQLTAAAARKSPSLVRWIADLAEIAPSEARSRLEDAGGRAYVANLIPELLDADGQRQSAARRDSAPRADTAISRQPRSVASDPEVDTTPRSGMFRRYDLRKARLTRARREPAAHQSEAIGKLQEWYRARPVGRRGGILMLPTGGGKTFTTVRFLCQEPLSDQYKVLWLANTHHLLEQAIDAFGPVEPQSGQSLEVAHIAEPMAQLDVRVVSGTPGHFPIASVSSSDDVLIGTLQTVASAFKRKHEKLMAFLRSADDKLFVVFDEAHHAPAPGYSAFIEELQKAHPEMYLLGLTATPTYSDERRQGWLARLFPQNVLSSVSRTRLIADGILAKPLFENAQTNISVELDEAEYQRWVSSYGDLPDTIIETLASNRERNDFIAETYVQSRERYGKTLIFADRWYQCDYLREALIKRGVRADVVYSHVDARLGSAEERNRRSKDENSKVIHQFKAGELDVLVNVKMLTEGTDVPSVKTVFLTRQTTSGILLTQMIGRALRGPRFGGTAEAHIVSFIDNWKQVISFVDYDSLPVGQADDGGAEYGKRPPLQLISIELVRRLARQMHTGGGGVGAPFVTLLPVGWYRVEYQTATSNSDDLVWTRQLVMVFANEKGRYEAAIDSLRAGGFETFASESVSLGAVRSRLETLRDELFASNESHPGTDLLTDLFHIARHIGQSGGEAPTFFRFEERALHDVDAIAKSFIERDLGPRALDEALLLEFQRVDRFWRSLYPTYGLFAAQYQAAQRRLLDAARHGADPERFGGVVNTPERIPPKEPSEAVKEAVKRRDGHRCCCCGSTRQLEIDHIVPVYLGGSSEMDQLQTLCRVCNGNKAINELNFRVTRSPLGQPPRLNLLEFPRCDDPADDDEWCAFIRRSINFYYQCSAVDSVSLDEATDGVKRRCNVQLRPDVDRDWLAPLAGGLQARVNERRAEHELLPIEPIQLSSIE